MTKKHSLTFDLYTNSCNILDPKKAMNWASMNEELQFYGGICFNYNSDLIDSNSKVEVYRDMDNDAGEVRINFPSENRTAVLQGSITYKYF